MISLTQSALQDGFVAAKNCIVITNSEITKCETANWC